MKLNNLDEWKQERKKLKQQWKTFLQKHKGNFWCLHEYGKAPSEIYDEMPPIRINAAIDNPYNVLFKDSYTPLWRLAHWTTSIDLNQCRHCGKVVTKIWNGED